MSLKIKVYQIPSFYTQSSETNYIQKFTNYRFYYKSVAEQKKRLASNEEPKLDGELNEQGKPRPERDHWEYVFVFELVWKSTY
jgi:hypothetical protein